MTTRLLSLCCLLVALVSSAFAQRPYVNFATAQFGYAQKSLDGSQQLVLAQLTAISPSVTARHLGQVLSVDGQIETIQRLVASPDNRWLTCLTFEDNPGALFLDWNVRSFDLRNGTLVGFTNEHSFARLNRSIYPSLRLQEYIARLQAAGAWDAGSDSALNYLVDVDSGNIPSPQTTWNSDGTLSVTFTFDVYATWSGIRSDFIGEETFTQNYVFNGIQFVSAGWGRTRTPATYPARFNLNAPSFPNNYKICFMDKVVTFSGITFKPTTRTAFLVEGVIPKLYLPGIYPYLP